MSATPLQESLRAIVAELTALDRRFALVGGLAVSVWVDPRLTRDADLVVYVVDDADAEALIRQLEPRYEARPWSNRRRPTGWQRFASWSDDLTVH